MARRRALVGLMIVAVWALSLMQLGQTTTAQEKPSAPEETAVYWVDGVFDAAKRSKIAATP